MSYGIGNSFIKILLCNHIEGTSTPISSPVIHFNLNKWYHTLIVNFSHYLYMRTDFFCPTRYILSNAWASNCGFQWGSSRNRWFPPMRFRPTPPAAKESSIICREIYTNIFLMISKETVCKHLNFQTMISWLWSASSNTTVILTFIICEQGISNVPALGGLMENRNA